MSLLSLQGAFTSGELSPSLCARVDLAKYQQGCKTLKNFLVQPHGGAVKRPGFLLLDTLPGDAALVPFVFNESDTYCLVFGERWMRIYQRGGPVMSGGKAYEIESPYTLAQARQMSFVQSADVLFIACKDQPPRKLKRMGGSHTNWQFEEMSFSAPVDPPGKPDVTFHNEAEKSDGSKSKAQIVTPYRYFISAVNADGKESETSKGTKKNGPASNNWQAGDYMTISWEEVKDDEGNTVAKEYRVYKSSFGGRAGYLATTGETEYKDYNGSPSLTEGAPKYTNPFPSKDYPSAVGLFEQRLVFASSPKRPQTIWMSKSGDYSNFATYVPITDDAPIELTLASPEVSPMCWMVALRSLILGSTSMEWELSSTQGAAFTAKSARATPQSYRGSTRLPALVIGNVLLHVSRSGSQVRDLQYDFGADSYSGTDRTILAAHLFENARIVNWTYQQAPDSIVWAVRSDGVLLGLTFQAEHEVFAWHQHPTDGAFKAVCSVPDGHEDTLFAVVLRNGVYCLERMADRYTGGDYSRAVFLDSAMIYEGAAATTLSGLAHLEGKVVHILSEGALEKPQVVKNGRVTLPRATTRAVAGLPYTADLESMPVEIAGEAGVSVGRKKYINEVKVLFKDTVCARIGLSFHKMDNVKWRGSEPHGSPLSPYSGLKSVNTRSLADNIVNVCVRSDEPTPMTVLALMPSIEVK